MEATFSVHTVMEVTVDGWWAERTKTRRRRNQTFLTVRKWRCMPPEHWHLLSGMKCVFLETDYLYFTAGHFPCKAISKIVQLPTEEG